MSKKYTFREITKKEEVEQFFKLRYKVYNDCELAPFLDKNDHKVDMDIYDLHARFFGIYCGEDLAAGLRVVIDKNEHYCQEAYEIGAGYKFFNGDHKSQEDLLKINMPDFPFLNYADIPQSINQFYERQRKSKKIYNIGRCVIDPAFRGLKTMQLLTEGIVTAIAYESGEQTGVVISDTRVSHARFYGRYGYTPIRNAPSYDVHGSDTVCLTGQLTTNLKLSSFPDDLHLKFSVMLEEYRTTNMLIREF